jgi:hypothetical protein
MSSSENEDHEGNSSLLLFFQIIPQQVLTRPYDPMSCQGPGMAEIPKKSLSNKFLAISGTICLQVQKSSVPQTKHSIPSAICTTDHSSKIHISLVFTR